MLKPATVNVNNIAERAEQRATDEAMVTNVFKVLHGYYGNPFFSKFATGTVSNGEDEGITNARRIWAHGLRQFDMETVKTALRVTQTVHPEWPPSLPQFTVLCMANRPREVIQHTALPMGQELRSAYARKARETIAKHEAKRNPATAGVMELPLSLDGLKVAIANAVGLAGGDESAELLRLDRMLMPRAAA